VWVRALEKVKGDKNGNRRQKLRHRKQIEELNEKENKKKGIKMREEKVRRELDK
jgi:hypothetical protein